MYSKPPQEKHSDSQRLPSKFQIYLQFPNDTLYNFLHHTLVSLAHSHFVNLDFK